MGNDQLDQKLNEYFAGKVVRKDLTQMMKSGANVPTFVLEYLLGMYCATDDEENIQIGIKKVKEILSKNFMRYDESNLIRSRIREQGSYTIIDKISAELIPEYDVYQARFANLDIGSFSISSEYVTKYEKILLGGIWVMAKVSYDFDKFSSQNSSDFDEESISKPKKKKGKYVEVLDSPFSVDSMKPIQMADVDYNEIIENRKYFSKEEWIDLLMRSSGFEPTCLTPKEKWHFLLRIVPLAERNYNLVELGPRSTGKSYIYKELSPYSLLVSGGYSSVSNLFYNLSSRRIGLVGLWDVVAFDEVAGIRYKELDGIQIMKDYMTSGSFARGREAINAEASLVFIGNINDSPETIMKISHLFSPFPGEFNNDSAFFDRIHNYLPGWEVPKLRANLFTDRFGFITDYVSEYLRAMRKKDFSHEFDKYFSFNKDVSKRDEIAIRKTVSGLIKLIYPDLSFTKEDLSEILDYAVEGRRRVKEQLKKMIGSEFSNINLGYIDLDTNNETIIYTTEQPKGTLISADIAEPGHVYGIGFGYYSELPGVFKLESKVVSGEGKFQIEGIGNVKSVKECFNASSQHFRDYSSGVYSGFKIEGHDFLTSFSDSQGADVSDNISLASFVSLCSAGMHKPVLNGLAIVGHFNLAGSLAEVTKLNDIFRVAKNAGASKLLIPISCLDDMQFVPKDYLTEVQAIFYNGQVDAAKKALGL